MTGKPTGLPEWGTADAGTRSGAPILLPTPPQPATPVGLLDPAALWDALPSELQREVGIAAVVTCVALRDETPGGDVAVVEAERHTDDVLAELLDDLPLPPQMLDLGALGLRMCHGCGCTDACGCADGCSWAGANLCSECADLVVSPAGPRAAAPTTGNLQ